MFYILILIDEFINIHQGGESILRSGVLQFLKGKNLLFIVKKVKIPKTLVGNLYEVIRVSDDDELIRLFHGKSYTPSKVLIVFHAFVIAFVFVDYFVDLFLDFLSLLYVQAIFQASFTASTSVVSGNRNSSPIDSYGGVEDSMYCGGVNEI